MEIFQKRSYNQKLLKGGYMNRRIVFSNELKQKLESINYSENPEWSYIGVSDCASLMSKIVKELNEKYNKLNISSFDFDDNVTAYGQKSTYFGLLKNDEDIVEAYLFVIPPKYETRSGVLAQQVFPVLSGIMEYYNYSINTITNRPIYIINANETNHTPSMVINIKSAEILNFKYVDVFNRDLDEILKSKGMKVNVKTIEEYNEWLIQLNDQNINEYFEIDTNNKTLYYLPTRLKDGVTVNNEPYWFVLKAYSALYLALVQKYKIDMTIFDSKLQTGNKTLDALRNYVRKFM